MDLTSLDTTAHAQAGADLTLDHPATGDPTDITITLLGADSEDFRKEKRRLEHARNSRIRRARSRRAVEEVAMDTTPEENAALLASCVTGWKGMVEDGKKIPFSASAATRIFLKYRWISEQVDAFVGDRGNFLPTA